MSNTRCSILSTAAIILPFSNTSSGIAVRDGVQDRSQPCLFAFHAEHSEGRDDDGADEGRVHHPSLCDFAVVCPCALFRLLEEDDEEDTSGAHGKGDGRIDYPSSRGGRGGTEVETYVFMLGSIDCWILPLYRLWRSASLPAYRELDNATAVQTPADAPTLRK